MKNTNLTLSQKSEFDYLRRKIKTLKLSGNTHNGTRRELFVAYEKLDEFVENLKKEGINVFV